MRQRLRTGLRLRSCLRTGLRLRSCLRTDLRLRTQLRLRPVIHWPQANARELNIKGEQTTQGGLSASDRDGNRNFVRSNPVAARPFE